MAKKLFALASIGVGIWGMILPLNGISLASGCVSLIIGLYILLDKP